MTDIQPGTYRARAVQGSAMLGYTSKGTEQVAVLLRIADGEYANQSIGWYGYFSEKAQERTIESLRHMGWQGTDLFDLSTIGDENAPDVNIVVEEEESEDGRIRTRVRWINKIGGGIALKDRMSDADAKSFAQRMKGAVLAVDQKAGAPKNNGGAGPKPAARKATPGPRIQEDESDLPF